MSGKVFRISKDELKASYKPVSLGDKRDDHVLYFKESSDVSYLLVDTQVAFNYATAQHVEGTSLWYTKENEVSDYHLMTIGAIAVMLFFAFIYWLKYSF